MMMCLVVGGVVCKSRFLLSSLLQLERGKEKKNRVVGRSGTSKAGKGRGSRSPTLKAEGKVPWGVNGRRVGGEVLGRDGRSFGGTAALEPNWQRTRNRH
jgi:hypothetical protein